MISELSKSVFLTLLLLVILGGIYPCITYGFAQLIFRDKANGSLVSGEGRVLGSRLLSQGFQGETYFHPRPSAAGSGHDASASGGSNLGPTSAKLRDSLRVRVLHYRKVNGLPDSVKVPADAVMASGSGLDPEISPANAELQAARVAHARNLDPQRLRDLIRENTRGRGLGFLGEPGVNVLTLNLALDKEP
ncbi:MAG TPA: K(+)-transporting ATPase subunit C [Fibrobacteria bacterium]|nr:K(+)-transporting ATPase subunit C [Fibrobacteria bacterium]